MKDLAPNLRKKFNYFFNLIMSHDSVATGYTYEAVRFGIAIVVHYYVYVFKSIFLFHTLSPPISGKYEEGGIRKPGN